MVILRRLLNFLKAQPCIRDLCRTDFKKINQTSVSLPCLFKLGVSIIYSNGNNIETKADESFDNGVFFYIEAKRTPSIFFFISDLFQNQVPNCNNI